MSKLDYVTIGIIVVCLAALGFLIYRTIMLRNQSAEPTQQETTQDDAYQDYDYDYLQDTNQILPPTEDYPNDAADLNATDNEPQPAESDDLGGFQETETYDEPVRTSSSSGDYLVLAGSFSVEGNAESHAEKLRDMGYANTAVEPFNRGAYAVVMVDRFRNESEARSLVQELQNKGIEAYVHQKREQPQ